MSRNNSQERRKLRRQLAEHRQAKYEALPLEHQIAQAGNRELLRLAKRHGFDVAFDGEPVTYDGV